MRLFHIHVGGHLFPHLDLVDEPAPVGRPIVGGELRIERRAPECLPGCDDDHHDRGCSRSALASPRPSPVRERRCLCGHPESAHAPGTPHLHGLCRQCPAEGQTKHHDFCEDQRHPNDDEKTRLELLRLQMELPKIVIPTDGWDRVRELQDENNAHMEARRLVCTELRHLRRDAACADRREIQQRIDQILDLAEKMDWT